MTSLARPSTPDFGTHVQSHACVLQPRMGLSTPAAMRAGLRAVRAARAPTVGTITLDSYTRVGDLAAAAATVHAGAELNGYPLLTHPLSTTRGLLDDGFPVQVRHGCATPGDIVEALLALGIGATEGGPVSYCLPYGRTPLATSVAAWELACARFATLRSRWGITPHVETFGGCLLGQLCPPSLLVAMSVLEALFFCRNGISSVSLSYAQQVNHDQDVAAVRALRRLAAELLPTDDWHVVVYAYMGVYPRTAAGAARLLTKAAVLAASTGAERLIVKTAAEAHRLPTIAENVAALEHAASVTSRTVAGAPPSDPRIYREAAAIVGAVLELSDDVGTALLRAFRRGYVDVPFCVHPDNAGRTRGYIDDTGRLAWDRIGRLPLGGLVRPRAGTRLRAADLLRDLNYVRDREDAMPPTTGAPVTVSSSSNAPVDRLLS